MDKVILGKSGIKISPIGLGCWPIGGEMYLDGKSDAYSNIDDNESIKAIHAGIDSGINFIDTSDCYGAGHSERVIGKAIKGIRDRVVIASKFGYAFNEENKHITHEDNSPQYIEEACMNTLKRLKTDYIDLYQFHVGYLKEDIANSAIKKLLELKQRGVIREIGWSTYDPKMLDYFPDKLAAVQYPSNVLNPNKELEKKCRDKKLLSLINSPLAMGLLGGKYRPGDTISQGDVRSSGFDWVTYFKDGKPDMDFYNKMDSVRDILTTNGRTIAQGAIAWLWGNSKTSVPIPGFRTVKQATENARAMEKGPLTLSQMLEIDKILT